MTLKYDQVADALAKLKFPEQGSDPSAFANDGYLYAKDVSGRTELVYMNDAGAQVQVTSDGYLNAKHLVETGGPTFLSIGAISNDQDLRRSGNSITGFSSPWRTALDLDFSTQASQSLSADQNYTIGGYTFTKVNSAHDSTAMALAEGYGIIIQPDSSSNYYTTTRTAPALTIGLSSLIPNLTLTSRIRVWLHISAFNGAAQYDSALLSIENPSTNSNYVQRKVFQSSATRLLSASTYNGGARTEIWSSSGLGSKTVLVLDLIGGVVGYVASQAAGVWSNGWPSPSSIAAVGLCGIGSATQSNIEAVGALSTWNVLIGALRGASATALSVTLAHLKIEYIL